MGPGDTPANTIVVVGQGSATLTPDAAVLQVGLETRAESAGEALGRVAERSGAVLSAARVQGVPDADLQTHGVSLLPQMDNQARRVVGYVASYSLALRLRDLSAAPAVVEAVSQAAGDALRLGGFHLSTSATEAARTEAGARAVQDARHRAERLAEAAGVRLGRVLSIVEAGVAMPASGPQVLRRGVATASAAPTVPVEAGSAELTARVTVSFEITD